MRRVNVILFRPVFFLVVARPCYVVAKWFAESSETFCSTQVDEPLIATGESCLLQQVERNTIARHRRLASFKEDNEEHHHESEPVGAATRGPTSVSPTTMANGPERVSLVVDGQGTSDAVNSRFDSDESQRSQQGLVVPLKEESLQSDVVDATMQFIDPEKLAVGLLSAQLNPWALKSSAAAAPPSVSTLAHSTVKVPSPNHARDTSQRYVKMKPWKKAVEFANAPLRADVLSLPTASLAAAPGAAKVAAAQPEAATKEASKEAAKEAPKEAPTEVPKAPASAPKVAPEEVAKSPAPGANETQPRRPAIAEVAKAPTAPAKDATPEAAVAAPSSGKSASAVAAPAGSKVASSQDAANSTNSSADGGLKTESLDLIPGASGSNKASTQVPESDSSVGSVLKWLVGSPSPAPALAPAAAPNPDLVKKAVVERRIDELSPKGDQHYTQHGCHCLLEWQHKGKAMHGCSKTEDQQHAWCKVLPDCQYHSGQPKDGAWDLCSVPGETSHHVTMHGCHCAPEFFHNGELWQGCSKTSAGPTWCYIFEGGGLCEGSQRTEHGGQHWDYCNVDELASPILTREGCHCQPEWVRDGEHHHGCIEATPDRKFPWCYVFEDESRCPVAEKDERGRLWDACWLLTDQDLAMLDTTVNSCHCEPEWEHDGATMKGCTKTHDRPKPWCYVIEDERLCKTVAGFGQGKERLQRWDWCDTSDHKPDLVPKVKPEMTPNVPQWQIPALQGRRAQEQKHENEDADNNDKKDLRSAVFSEGLAEMTGYLACALAILSGCLVWMCCCRQQR